MKIWQTKIIEFTTFCFTARLFRIVVWVESFIEKPNMQDLTILNPEVNFISHVVFPRICYLDRGYSPFNKPYLSWKFIEVPQVLQNIWRFSPSILTIFTDFWIFWNSFVAKKLMTSAYSRWYQQFYTFNLL